jgi:hypothetical protein
LVSVVGKRRYINRNGVVAAMSPAAMMELHHALQLLVKIPGAFSHDAGAACSTSANYSSCNESGDDDNHEQVQHSGPPNGDHTHRRLLRRIERALASLLDTGFTGGEDMMETDGQNHRDESSSPVMWLAEDDNDAVGVAAATVSKQHLECSHTATQLAANDESSENFETLKEDLVAVVHGLCLSDDDVKQELVESCITAAAQAIVSFQFTLTGDHVVSILNRLLLMDANVHQNIQSLLLWVLNRQFQDGITISSASIAVLASFEVLEIVTKDFSADCLVEDVPGIQRSWYTLTGYLIRFSIPDRARFESPADLRDWLMERITEGAINGAVEDMASHWMSNACQLVLSVANFALDALDTNNMQQAVYYATLTYQIMTCFDSAFDKELQPTASRLWVALASSNLNESSDCMDHDLQYSIASLSLDLYDVIRDRDETTTIVLLTRSLHFSDLATKSSHLLTVIPKRTLQCMVLTMLRQQPGQHALTEQILERLTAMKCDGDLMDTFFWNQVDAASHQNQYMEAG